MKMQTNLSTIENDVDLFEIINTIWRNKYTILFFTILAACLSIVYAYGKTPIYKADVLLQVEAKQASIPGFEELAGLTEETATVGTEIALIKSRKNLGQAVDALKLDIKAQPKKLPILSNFYKRFFSKNTINKPPKLWKSFDRFIHKYAWGSERIKVESIEVPDIYVNEPLTLVSKINDSFDIYTEERKLLLTGKVGAISTAESGNLKIFVSELKALPGTEFIVSKRSKLSILAGLKTKIKAKEQGKKTGIIYMSLQGSNKREIAEILDHISQTYLAQNKSRSSEEATTALNFLKEQVKPVKSLVDEAEGNLSKYRTDNKTADLSLETQAILGVVTGIDTELQKLALKRDELSQRYTNNHPTIQAIISQEQKLKKRKDGSLSKVTKLPKKQQRLLKLERDFKVANTIYNEIINNIQEFKIAEASSVGNVYIIDSAITHGRPVKPKRPLLIAVGTLLGIILGLAVVVIQKMLHRTVDNPEKLEDATGIPVYTTVPLSDGVKQAGWFKSKNITNELLASQDMTDPAIESLRSLRTSLHFALLEAKNNIVMITGPSPGIGKSFITSNFAAVIAASKQSVLLIDADMRKGYLHELINKEISPGLSDLISEKSTLEEVVHTVEFEDDAKMDVITRGHLPPNPSELLMHSNFEKFLSYASSKYDLVLLDTPPIHAVTDPTIIGKHSGVVFMVVHSDKHHMKEIEHAVKRLSQTGVIVKGFIFNGYVAKNEHYGYGYNSYYGDYKS